MSGHGSSLLPTEHVVVAQPLSMLDFLKENSGRIPAIVSALATTGFAANALVTEDASQEQYATAFFNLAMVFNIANRAVDICKDPDATLMQKAGAVTAVVANLFAAGLNFYNAITGSKIPSVLVQGPALGAYAYATMHFKSVEKKAIDPALSCDNTGIN